MNGTLTKIWNAFERLLKFVVYKILRFQLSDKSWAGLMQFVKFGIVGFTNTIIGYLIYVVSLKGLRAVNLFATADIYVAQLIMFLLSVAWSFFWNNTLVFKQEEGEERNILAALIKTYVSYAFTGLFLAEALLMLWVNVFGINEYIAPIINLIITVPLNFIIQKYWAFKNEK